MMKKHKIKRLATAASGDICVVEVEAEIYEYKGLQFGIFWTKNRKDILAIELQTGCPVGEFAYTQTKTPRKDLLQRIACFVDEYNYKQAISLVRDRIAKKHEELNVRIHELEEKRSRLVFPLNERVVL